MSADANKAVVRRHYEAVECQDASSSSTRPFGASFVDSGHPERVDRSGEIEGTRAEPDAMLREIATSLNSTLRLHATPRLNGWLLFVRDCSIAVGGRLLMNGTIWSEALRVRRWPRRSCCLTNSLKAMRMRLSLGRASRTVRTAACCAALLGWAAGLAPSPIQDHRVAVRAQDTPEAIRTIFAALPGDATALAILPDGRQVGQEPDRAVPSASVIKLWVAGAAYAAAAAGTLDLSESYTVTAGDQASGTGILNEPLNLGRTLTYADLIQTMLIYSDNSATNVIVRRIGGDATVNAYAAQQGYPATLLQRPLGQLDPTHDNYTSAADCVLFLQRAQDGDLPAGASAPILSALRARRRAEDPAYDYFGRYLPPTVDYLHISGLGPNVRNDAGYYPSQGSGVFVAVLLSDLPDEAAGEAALGQAVAGIQSLVP
jgi:beta-lactamase class A